MSTIMDTYDQYDFNADKFEYLDPPNEEYDDFYSFDTPQDIGTHNNMNSNVSFNAFNDDSDDDDLPPPPRPQLMRLNSNFNPKRVHNNNNINIPSKFIHNNQSNININPPTAPTASSSKCNCCPVQCNQSSNNMHCMNNNINNLSTYEPTPIGGLQDPLT
eukprot:843712_1